MSHRFGPVAHDPAVCGCHVHVGVPDRELAVQVCNHLRPWLPVVQALTANSPLHDGRDTGHASWRAIQFDRWPSVGPTPHFDSVADYDRTVRDLVDAGIMLDPEMVYWYARPSVAYPTVEIRVGDVCPTVDDTVLVAGLLRALVATAAEDVRTGRPAPRLRDCLVAAAHWRAAHDGVDGDLVDLRAGGSRPAWELIDELVATVTPALAGFGDLDLVTRQLDRLRRDGNGATRQRRILAHTDGDVRAVLAELAARTLDT
jgi:carboxylate-amine ligase